MIVPMKKVLLLAQSSCKEEALKHLRDAGVMQISMTEDTSKSTDYAANTVIFGRRVSEKLHRIAEENELPEYPDSGLDGKALLGKSGILIEHIAAIDTELDAVNAKLKRLAPWGRFDRKLLEKLNADGIEIKLCSAGKKDFERIAELPGVVAVKLNGDRKKINFAVIGSTDDEIVKIHSVKLDADDDPVALEDKYNAFLISRGEAEQQLARFAAEVDKIDDYLVNLESDWEFSLALDSCADYREVIALNGFVPDFAVDTLREAAKNNGWGLVITDPEESDHVPVLLKESRFERMIKPLFDFLGILPGYREMDISGGILIFFTIFYAMIIGDAGYGAVFCLAALLATLKFRRNEKMKTPLKLFWILSIATVIWGTLSGNYFGTKHGGLKCLTGENQNIYIQIFCFLLAVAQLSLGHIWKAIHDGNWKSICANTGWMLIIWGNFFLALRVIVMPGDFPTYMYYFYGIGLILVLVCGVNWGNVADIFQLPFSVIGSFSDLLSYIRLFAVGMAGSYIAANFNGMGLDIIKTSPWLIIGGIAVILFGHVLNVALGMMSVLVHAVRLNTLEFSNHTGLTWSGIAFNPFKNKLPTNNHKETEK